MNCEHCGHEMKDEGWQVVDCRQIGKGLRALRLATCENASCDVEGRTVTVLGIDLMDEVDGVTADANNADRARESEIDMARASILKDWNKR